MSNRNNDVFRVLPVTNCTLLPDGGQVESLGIGQLGAFDADTNLSIDPTTSPMPKKFILLWLTKLMLELLTTDYLQGSQYKDKVFQVLLKNFVQQEHL